MRSAIEQNLVKVIGKIKPSLGESQFLSAGVLTPAEFVVAGDLLVYKCPAWKWEAGDPKKAVSYLPKDKQYLITRNVPCTERASNLQKQAEKNTYRDVEVDGDDGWVCDDSGRIGHENEDAEEVPDAAPAPKTASSNSKNNHDDDDDDDDGDIPDMDSYSNEDNVDEAAAAIKTKEAAGENNLVQSRSYDISITYDNYYATPKMWLFGYSENGEALTPQEIFEDISEDHARKTVTLDNHPHMENRTFAFIHPCKHSAVIKSLIDRMVANNHVPRVDHCLFIFLKFMSAVIPTIDYDLSPGLIL
jgi:ubiquitin-like-conjugating enzyme ATG3